MVRNVVSAWYGGDPAGYEEGLYQTVDGNRFLYCNGGSESPYPRAEIRPMTDGQAAAWQARYSSGYKRDANL